MSYVYITLAFVVGLIVGMAWTMRQIREALRETRGLSSDTKRDVYLILGIEP